MFELDFVTYARVAHDATSTGAVLRPIDEGVRAFLQEHITKLDELAKQRDSPAGRFTDNEAQSLFRDLSMGTKAQFLAAAGALTKRLNVAMDRRAAAGLLVALRARTEAELVAGVLKLEVVAEHAAVLDQLDSGEVVLSAARNVMDKPGELKKGALTRSSLRDHEVLVGDRLTYEAAYFPRAFGIRIYARPTEAARELFKALHELAPGLVGPVARKISAVRPGEIGEVLRALGDLVPDLTEGVQLRVIEKLEDLPRAVGRIDTEGRYRQILNAGAIQVSGPVADMEELVSVEPAGDGRWQVRIDLAEKPEISYRS